MGRKSKIQKEIEAKQKEIEIRQKEIDALLEADKKLKEDAKAEIEKILGEKLFCGVILNKEDLITILRLALETGESVKIEYQLYNIEED